MNDTTPLDTSRRDDRLRQRAATSGPRVERVEEDGEVFWIKRPEMLSLRMRLQKGSAREAFAAEVQAHKDYSAQGLPVAPLVLACDSYLVTADSGPSLLNLARRAAPDFPDALAAAARALAVLHAAGMSHGRPSLKDMCWRAGQIAFLDLERAGRGSAVQDVQIMVFSTAAETRGDVKAMEIVRDGYIAATSPDAWRRVQRKATWLVPLGVLFAPVAWLLPKNREFSAIRPFLKFIQATP